MKAPIELKVGDKYLVAVMGLIVVEELSAWTVVFSICGIPGMRKLWPRNKFEEIVISAWRSALIDKAVLMAAGCITFSRLYSFIVPPGQLTPAVNRDIRRDFQAFIAEVRTNFLVLLSGEK